MKHCQTELLQQEPLTTQKQTKIRKSIHNLLHKNKFLITTQIKLKFYYSDLTMCEVGKINVYECLAVKHNVHMRTIKKQWENIGHKIVSYRIIPLVIPKPININIKCYQHTEKNC
jgi:hypothetical protein